MVNQKLPDEAWSGSFFYDGGSENEILIYLFAMPFLITLSLGRILSFQAAQEAGIEEEAAQQEQDQPEKEHEKGDIAEKCFGQVADNRIPLGIKDPVIVPKKQLMKQNKGLVEK